MKPKINNILNDLSSNQKTDKQKQKIIKDTIDQYLINLDSEDFEFLINHESNQYTRQDFWGSVLISGNKNLTNHLLDQNIDVEKDLGLDKNLSYLSSLDVAAINNDVDLIHKIMDKASPDFIDRQDDETKTTALMHASMRRNHHNAIKALLEYEPDLLLKNNNNLTALDIAKNTSELNYNIFKSYIQNESLKVNTQLKTDSNQNSEIEINSNRQNNKSKPSKKPSNKML